MPWLQVHILEGTPEQEILDLMEGLTQVTATTLHVPRDIVRVVVNEHRADHWAVGGEPLSVRGPVFEDR